MGGHGRVGAPTLSHLRTAALLKAANASSLGSAHSSGHSSTVSCHANGSWRRPFSQKMSAFAGSMSRSLPIELLASQPPERRAPGCGPLYTRGVCCVAFLPSAGLEQVLSTKAGGPNLAAAALACSMPSSARASVVLQEPPQSAWLRSARDVGVGLRIEVLLDPHALARDLAHALHAGPGITLARASARPHNAALAPTPPAAMNSPMLFRHSCPSSRLYS